MGGFPSLADSVYTLGSALQYVDSISGGMHSSLEGAHKIRPAALPRFPIQMTEAQRLAQKLSELRSRWKELHESIAKDESYRIRETRPEEQDRYAAILADKRRDLQQIEAEFADLEAQDARLRLPALIQEARRRERTGAYGEAIEVWEEIRELKPAEPDIAGEIKRLASRRDLARTLRDRIKQLTARISEIEGIFKDVVETLKRSDLDPEGAILDAVDHFLRKELSPQQFALAWSALAGLSGSRAGDEPDFKALAGRLERGEIVLFLGPDIASLYQVPCYDALVLALANQVNYPGLFGSLPTIGEYYQIQTDYGRSSLVNHLHDLLHSGHTRIPLYAKLARIDQPLVLISSAYDTFIEDAFHEAGKPYALLSSILDPASVNYNPPSKRLRKANADGFDVFLSHSSQDKPLVRELKQALVAAGLSCWLDADELVPGENWQPGIEAAMRDSVSAAVCFGPAGIGPWEDEEMQALLTQAVRAKKRVIPVLLPGAPQKPTIPAFLGNRTWVDLRSGFTPEGLERLVWGITGRKPEAAPKPAKDGSSPDPATALEIGSLYLQYSDGQPSRTFKPKEELSGLALVEEGYSFAARQESSSPR